MASFSRASRMVTVPDRMPLFKFCLLHPVIGHPVNPVTANAFIDKPAVAVAVKIIPDDAASIVSMQSFMSNMVAVFPAAQAEVTFAEVRAVNKDEGVFTKVEV